jgi:hypothetical protein
MIHSRWYLRKKRRGWIVFDLGDRGIKSTLMNINDWSGDMVSQYVVGLIPAAEKEMGNGGGRGD